MNTDLLPLEISNIPIEEPQKIKRQYLFHRHEKEYPIRYNNAVFEKFNEMNSDTALQNDYKQWKTGINYKTNRKITIGKKLHRELREKFMISYSHNYRVGYETRSSVLFEDLTNINSDIYLQETDKINNDIDIENSVIKDYNKTIDSIVEKIKKLESWDDFIVFEGKKYGLVNKIKKNIHMENNCYGKMVYLESGIYSFHKCSKCNYETNREIFVDSSDKDEYVSKIGFWWK